MCNFNKKKLKKRITNKLNLKFKLREHFRFLISFVFSFQVFYADSLKSFEKLVISRGSTMVAENANNSVIYVKEIIFLIILTEGK